jgi:hypothetical protein
MRRCGQFLHLDHATDAERRRHEAVLQGVSLHLPMECAGCHGNNIDAGIGNGRWREIRPLAVDAGEHDQPIRSTMPKAGDFGAAHWVRHALW